MLTEDHGEIVNLVVVLAIDLVVVWNELPSRERDIMIMSMFNPVSPEDEALNSLCLKYEFNWTVFVVEREGKSKNPRTLVFPQSDLA